MGNEQQRGSSNRYPGGGYYTALPNGAPAAAMPVAQPVRMSTPPSSSSTLASRPPTYHHQHQQSAPPATSPAYYNPSYQYYEDESAARSREERASAMAAKVAKYQVKKKVTEQSKAASWKKYDALGKAEEQNKQISSVGYRLADGLKVSAATANGTLEQKHAPSAPPSELSDDDVFEQQIAAMSAKVRKMPLSTVTLLKKILGNVLKTPPSDAPSPAASRGDDPMKFRRLKLGNEKISKEIVGVDGGMQLLLGVGFDEGVWNGERVLTFHLKTPTDLVEVALEQLNELFPESSINQSPSANVTPNSSNTTLKKPPSAK